MGNGDPSGGKADAPPKAEKPKLPDNAPAALGQFLDCKGNRLTFKQGKIPWLKGKPSVAFAEGEQAGTINVSAGYGIVSLTLPVSVKDGKLDIDTTKVPDLSEFVEGLGPQAIEDWEKQLNDWLKSNGKQLGPLTLKDGAVTIPKVAIPAPAKQAGLLPAGKPAEPAKPGIKAAAGTGAALLGFGLGTLFGVNADATGDGVSVPNDPVPIEEAALPETMPLPVMMEVVHLPEGPVTGSLTITGAPGSFTGSLTLEQNGNRLIFDFEGQVFRGRIDDQANLLVDNPNGSFEGSIEGDRVTAEHIFQGEVFQAEGELDQPVVTDTVTEDGPTMETVPLAGGIGDGVVFQPVGTGNQAGGGGLGVVGGLVLLGIGGGLIVLDFQKGKRITAQDDGAIGGILEGFAGIGAPPVTTTTKGIGWDGAVTIWEQHQEELIEAFSDALTQFKDAWANAMTHLDEFRETFNRLVSASTQMQGLLVEWEEEREIRKKQDLAFAIATLVVGGFGLAKSGFKLFTTWKGGGAAAEILTKLKPGEAQILQSLAKEAGKDLSQLLTKHGGDVAAVMQELFYTVFNKRGWHYLGKTQVFIDAVVKEVDIAETVAQILTGARTGLRGATGGTAAALAENVKILKEIAARDPRFIEGLKTAVVDIAIQGEKGGFLSIHAAAGSEALVAELSIARATGNAAEVARLEQLLVKAGASQAATATVKLLDDLDYALLQKLLDSGGDLGKLSELLGPAGIEGLAAGAAKTAPWAPQLGAPGFGLTGVGLLGMTGGVLGGKQLDVGKFSDQFGLTDSGKTTFMGLYGTILWGFLTSPFETYGKISKTLDALDQSKEFLGKHGNDLLKLSSELKKAALGFDQAARGIRNSRLAGRLQDAAGKLDGDIRDLQRALGGLPPDEQADAKKKFGEIKKEIGRKITAVGDTVDQLHAAQQTAAHLAELFGAWARTKGVGVLDPNVLGRVEAARGLLLGMMNAMIHSPLPGVSIPPGWGFSPQLGAELRAWQLDHGPKTAEPLELDEEGLVKIKPQHLGRGGSPPSETEEQEAEEPEPTPEEREAELDRRDKEYRKEVREYEEWKRQQGK